MPTTFHAFLHTNRHVRSASEPHGPPSGFAVHTGWWADDHDMRPYEKGRKGGLFRREEFPFHARFASHQAFKYQWLARISEPQAAWNEPWLLMDTDTIVQCSPRELRQRFRELGAPLVIGGEFQWWPKRDRTHDPWAPTPTRIRYPNSGMLLGTRSGYNGLERAFKAMPRYPCCPKMIDGKLSPDRCHIDDQHCLQAALLQGGLQWALDVNASLFLNLLGVLDEDLVRQDGRCVYRPTGRAPCVLHSNGKMAKPKMANAFRCIPDTAWVVPAGKNLTASALFPTTHRR
jgi:hypothetical protein